MTEWIKADEAVPEFRELVLTLDENSHYKLATYEEFSGGDYYRSEAWYDMNDERFDPIFWMPLPEKPDGI